MVDEIKKPDASALGSNAYTHFCDYHGQRRFYGVCAYLIDHGFASKATSDESSCSMAMQRESCAAMAMRAEEVEKGQAIYLIERKGSMDRPRKPEEQQTRVDTNSASYKLGWAKVGGEQIKRIRPVAAPKRVAPLPPKPEGIEGHIVNADYANALNKTVEVRKHESDNKSVVNAERLKEMRQFAETIKATRPKEYATLMLMIGKRETQA